MHDAAQAQVLHLEPGLLAQLAARRARMHSPASTWPPTPFQRPAKRSLPGPGGAAAAARPCARTTASRGARRGAGALTARAPPSSPTRLRPSAPRAARPSSAASVGATSSCDIRGRARRAGSRARTRRTPASRPASARAGRPRAPRAARWSGGRAPRREREARRGVEPEPRLGIGAARDISAAGTTRKAPVSRRAAPRAPRAPRRRARLVARVDEGGAAVRARERGPARTPPAVESRAAPRASAAFGTRSRCGPARSRGRRRPRRRVATGGPPRRSSARSRASSASAPAKAPRRPALPGPAGAARASVCARRRSSEARAPARRPAAREVHEQRVARRARPRRRPRRPRPRRARATPARVARAGEEIGLALAAARPASRPGGARDRGAHRHRPVERGDGHALSAASCQRRRARSWLACQ